MAPRAFPKGRAVCAGRGGAPSCYWNLSSPQGTGEAVAVGEEEEGGSVGGDEAVAAGRRRGRGAAGLG